MSTIRKALLVVAVALLALIPASVAQSPTVAQASVTATTQAWAYPQSERDAASACFLDERERRGIPGPGSTTPGRTIDDYIAWWNSHAGTQARADWHAAYVRCQDRHLVTSPWR